MAGPVAFVSGAATGFGAAMASALERSSVRVGDLGAVADLSTPDGAAAAFERAVSTAGTPHAVVHTAVDPVALGAVALADMDDARFASVWEEPMRATLFVLQAAHRHLVGRGGRIVLVTPTLALSGAPGLAAYAAAVEGQRLMAKSAARQWGSDGITVNCIAPSAVTVGVDPGDLGAVTLTPPALGGTGDVGADIAPVVAFLLGDGAHFVTGATIAVDGGAWLAP